MYMMDDVFQILSSRVFLHLFKNQKTRLSDFYEPTYLLMAEE